MSTGVHALRTYTEALVQGALPEPGAPAKKDPRSLEEQFAAFDAAHPDIYREFVRYCTTLKFNRRFAHYSARTIISVMRFHSQVDSGPDAAFKLNNNWSPYYARKLMAEDDRFIGWFEMRTVRSDSTRSAQTPSQE